LMRLMARHDNSFHLPIRRTPWRSLRATADRCSGDRQVRVVALLPEHFPPRLRSAKLHCLYRTSLGEDHPFECLPDGTGERPELAGFCPSQQAVIDPKLPFMERRSSWSRKVSRKGNGARAISAASVTGIYFPIPARAPGLLFSFGGRHLSGSKPGGQRRFGRGFSKAIAAHRPAAKPPSRPEKGLPESCRLCRP